MNDQPPLHTTTPPPRREGGGDEDVVDLVGRLTRQSAHLAGQQIALVQAELREGIHDVKTAIGAVAGAATFGIAGLVVLLIGVSYLVAEAVENLALGTIITGAATLLIAGIMLLVGRSKASAANLKPKRSIDTVEDAPAAVTGQMHNTGGSHAR